MSMIRMKMYFARENIQNRNPTVINETRITENEKQIDRVRHSEVRHSLMSEIASNSNESFERFIIHLKYFIRNFAPLTRFHF